MNIAPDNHTNEMGQPSLGSAAEFEALLRSSMDELLVKTGSHQDAWGFGQEETWFLDHGSGELIFTFPDLVVSAPAQVIGHQNQETGLWTWSWADPVLPEALQIDACRVRDYGAQHGFQHLVTGSWPAEESHCWYMTALACWLCGAKGAYRGLTGNIASFVTFGDVISNPVPELPSGTGLEDFMTASAEDFRQSASSPEAQREACCRYLRQGALQGIAQSELIHCLGLATPSVLDLAGYSPESAQNVMDLLKTISDDELEQHSAGLVETET